MPRPERRPARANRQAFLQAGALLRLTKLAAIGALRVVELPLAVDLPEILAVGAVDRLVAIGLALCVAAFVQGAVETAFASARQAGIALDLAHVAVIGTVQRAVALNRAAVLPR